MLAVTAVCFAVELPTDMEMSKVVADLEYVLVDSCCLVDEADLNTGDNAAGSSGPVVKVQLFYMMLAKTVLGGF